MKKIILVALTAILIGSPAYAVNSMQIFIDGATYDWNQQSWVTTRGSFDIYIVSANSARKDIVVSLALANRDLPGNVDVTFNGNNIDDSAWRYGFAPITYAPGHWDGGNDDLSRHGVFPTWFTEVHTGAYGLTSRVGNIQPNALGNYWNPATGEGSASALGQTKMFHVETGGIYTFVHFDAYTVNSDGSINENAPFSHDATANSVPEPGTIALMGTGLLGILTAYRRRKL